MKLTVNGTDYELEVEPGMPLFWALRDELNIKGPKFGCGMTACGACTVHVDGDPVRSCSLPVGEVEGEVTTIGGIGDTENLHAMQQAWIAKQVPQCGYCQSGQIMSDTPKGKSRLRTIARRTVLIGTGAIAGGY